MKIVVALWVMYFIGFVMGWIMNNLLKRITHASGGEGGANE